MNRTRGGGIDRSAAVAVSVKGGNGVNGTREGETLVPNVCQYTRDRKKKNQYHSSIVSDRYECTSLRPFAFTQMHFEPRERIIMTDYDY